MRVLFLDLASHLGTIACVSDDELVASVEVHAGMRDDELIPAAENLLQQANCSWNDLTHIACVVGPGGFTSLRVASAFVNTLADQLQLPVAAVHLSDLCKARSKEDDLLWLHSTRKTELFVRGFGAYQNVASQPEHRSLDGLELPRQAVFTGELIDAHQFLIEQYELRSADRLPDTQVLPVFLAHVEYGSVPVLPWYGRGI